MITDSIATPNLRVSNQPDPDRSNADLAVFSTIGKLLTTQSDRHHQTRALEVVAELIARELKARRSAEHQPPHLEGGNKPGSFKRRVDLLETEMIVDALNSTRGNMTAAARQLGITPRMIRYKIMKLGIDYHKLLT